MAEFSLLDPVLLISCQATVSLILLHAAWQKFQDLATFETIVSMYAILPNALVQPFSWLLPMLEVIAAFYLVINPQQGGGLFAAFLLFLVTFGIFFNLIRGRVDLECGCGGDSHPRLSWALLIRNLVLIGLALLSAVSITARSAVWMDYVTETAFTFTLISLYFICTQLLANSPNSHYKNLRS